MRGLLWAIGLALVSALSLAVLAAVQSTTENKADNAPVKIGLLLDSLKVDAGRPTWMYFKRSQGAGRRGISGDRGGKRRPFS
jgi:hypothetical protein